MAQITLRGINKIYPNGTHAVHDVDLDIADGEFMIMVGPSGCAKSTILRMIAGLETPSSGLIDIGGRTVNQVAPKDRDIAMVFQSYALYPHMTVRDNMAFGLRLRKMSEGEIQQRVDDAARILGLEQLLDRLPKQMSGGQRQRVAMGRAIVREPQAFLMDEPLSNLDAKLRVQMRTEIAKLHQRLGTTTVYVTHDQVEAMTLGHRICILRKGIVQQVDTPYMVYNNPANVFVGGFIGSPGMNFLTGTLHAFDGDARLTIGTSTFTLPEGVARRLLNDPSPNAKHVIVGIRPEHLHEVHPGSATPSLVAQVDLIEALGSEAFAYLNFDIPAPDLSSLSDTQAASTTHVARLEVGHHARQGAPIHLAPDVHHVHLFDPSTHASLLAPRLEHESHITIHHQIETAPVTHHATSHNPQPEPVAAPMSSAISAAQMPITEHDQQRAALRVGIASERARAELGDIDPALLLRRSRHSTQLAPLPPVMTPPALPLPPAEPVVDAPGVSFASPQSFNLPPLSKSNLFQQKSLFARQ